MKILILGATGMLGNAFFNYFMVRHKYQVIGTMRSISGRRYFPEQYHSQLLVNIDVLDQDTLVSVFEKVRPQLVINCIGLIKQLDQAKDPLLALPINAMLPHRLLKLCSLLGARLIHFSTDCVFSGKKGMYHETDLSDADDLYGKSKFIGEICDSPTALTLRTSIIGHELGTNFALVDWFLTQSTTVKGYKKAIFSGLPTMEVASVVDRYVIPKPELSGLYHVSAAPIDKLSLLKIVAEEYKKDIEILPDESVCIDRSLDSSRFRQITGYSPPSWEDLVRLMRESQLA